MSRKNYMKWIDWEWIFEWAIHKIASEFHDVTLPVTQKDLIEAEEAFYLMVTCHTARQEGWMEDLINETLDYYKENICKVYRHSGFVLPSSE
jgi:hypothetical protein